MKLQGLAGLIVFVLIAWAFSENRRQVKIRIIIAGILIQIFIGFVLLKLSFFRQIFLSFNNVIIRLEESSKAGTSMVFGYLGGGPLPFDEKIPGSSFILAFQALPLILFMSALSSFFFTGEYCP